MTKPKGDRVPVKPYECRVDALTPEQRDMLAAVVVFARLSGMPSTSDVAELLDWPRERVTRVGGELVELGMLDWTRGRRSTDN